MNPSDAYPGGMTTIGNLPVVAGGVTSTAYTKDLNFQVFWLGAKYSILSNLDVTGGYYHYNQANYDTNPGANCVANTTAPVPGYAPQGTKKGDCAGTLDAVSGMIDWHPVQAARPLRRPDVLAGGWRLGFRLPAHQQHRSDCRPAREVLIEAHRAFRHFGPRAYGPGFLFAPPWRAAGSELDRQVVLARRHTAAHRNVILARRLRRAGNGGIQRVIPSYVEATQRARLPAAPTKGSNICAGYVSVCSPPQSARHRHSDAPRQRPIVYRASPSASAIAVCGRTNPRNDRVAGASLKRSPSASSA